MLRSLKDHVAWITGAGSGIGAAAAVVLAEAGVKVILSGRRREALEASAAAITAAGGPQAIVEDLDVAERGQAMQVAGRIEQRFGRLDILVNNAGINVTQRHWAEPDLDAWDKLIKININGVYNCTAAVLPLMRRQRDGLIINISSWAGRHHGYVGGVAYSASKHAVVSLNASLNVEEGRHGIRACVICPGEVATPILEQRPVKVSDEEKARMLQSEDLGQTVLFVARLPARACVNEILISPTHNRAHQGGPGLFPPPAEPYMSKF